MSSERRETADGLSGEMRMRDGAPHGGSRELSKAPRGGMLLTPAVPAGAVSAACSVPSRPNIIFILAADLGCGDLSSYGATAVRTPNIDRLADKGVLLTDAHSPSSVCTPTRYSWPGRIKAGTRSAETATLADMMATFAASAGEEVPRETWPDSLNVIPALVGGTLGESARRPRVMHSGGNGMLALREGPWKLIDGQGGGGNRDGEAEAGAPPPPYNLDQDLGEARNLYALQRETALRLQEALRRIRTEGRSR